MTRPSLTRRVNKNQFLTQKRNFKTDAFELLSSANTAWIHLYEEMDRPMTQSDVPNEYSEPATCILHPTDFSPSSHLRLPMRCAWHWSIKPT